MSHTQITLRFLPPPGQGLEEPSYPLVYYNRALSHLGPVGAAPLPRPLKGGQWSQGVQRVATTSSSSHVVRLGGGGILVPVTVETKHLLPSGGAHLKNIADVQQRPPRPGIVSRRPVSTTPRGSRRPLTIPPATSAVAGMDFPALMRGT